MIDSREKLKEWIKVERQLCQEYGYKGRLHAFITQCEIGKIAEFLRILRCDEYYTNTSGKNIFRKFLALYYRRKHNKLGLALGISIPVNTFGKGLMIFHSQGIIVHRDARCGEYCRLHGMNCIGNNGKGSGENNCPVIGDNFDLGVGAKVIGNVEIADEVSVGANAVVCKSEKSKGAVLVGIPAKRRQ